MMISLWNVILDSEPRQPIQSCQQHTLLACQKAPSASRSAAAAVASRSTGTGARARHKSGLTSTDTGRGGGQVEAIRVSEE